MGLGEFLAGRIGILIQPCRRLLCVWTHNGILVALAAPVAFADIAASKCREGGEKNHDEDGRDDDGGYDAW